MRDLVPYLSSSIATIILGASILQCNGDSEGASRVNNPPATGGTGATGGADGGQGNRGPGSGGTLNIPPPDAGCAGASCVTSVCGDGAIDATTAEECDDSNTDSGDGCNATCQVEQGWICPFPGLSCDASECGDGIIAGKEQCDFASATQGCDASTCQVTPGFACDATGCHRTTCGDNNPEGDEACDDGNFDWGDGCTPDCKSEPDCSGASCTSRCGDGLLLPGSTNEACDDGNTQADDGCSPTCEVEAGYKCELRTTATGGTLVLPIVYRDMKKRQDTGGHPNFEVDPGAGAAVTGMVGTTLDAEGKPTYAATATAQPTSATNGWTTNATDFSTWFRDSAYSKTVVDTLTLRETSSGSGTFVFSATEFFPLDGRGWNDPPLSGTHNYYFTSEVRYWFQWKGGETLTFFGDDDVWVFVNKKLAVDIGGVHNPITRSVTLNAATNTSLGLGLEMNQVYEITVFQAERHVTGSQYQLTLAGFNVGRSECAGVCGDGVVTRGELCDDGTENNTGAYGRCGPDCKQRGGFCGDGTIQPEGGEACDDGNRNVGDGCDSVCKVEIIR